MIGEHAPDGADASTPMLATRALFEIGWGDGDLADAGVSVGEILDANPGLRFGDAWDTVTFTGGSSIGVIGGS